MLPQFFSQMLSFINNYLASAAFGRNFSRQYLSRLCCVSAAAHACEKRAYALSRGTGTRTTYDV